MSIDINYVASPTGQAFHASTERVKAIVGPVGAGKTVVCVMDMLAKALAQTANSKGVRQTRFVAIRQSYPQLVSTVIKTFMDWIGPLGKMSYGTPVTWKAKFPVADGTIVDMEVIFLALERAEDAAKLRSLEVSHGYISEFAEIPPEVMDMLRGRIGRFPAKRHGAECLRKSILMESNPPTTRSHWYNLFEVERPRGHKLFRQPAPLFYDPDKGEFNNPDAYIPNPLAENIEWLDGGFDYYLDQIPGASRNYISVYILGEYGTTFSGQPIFEEYTDSEHCAPQVLRPVAKTQLVAGIDFGLNAAVVLTELTPIGALHVLEECCGADVMLEQFLEEEVRPTLQHGYTGWPVMFVGDPSDNSGRAGYTLLHQMRYAAVPSFSNDPIMRWDAVKFFLSRRNGFTMSPSCTVLREGFLGGYKFKAAQSTNAPHTGRADKNHTSHPHDALQYAAMKHREASIKAARNLRRASMGQHKVKRHLWA